MARKRWKLSGLNILSVGLVDNPCVQNATFVLVKGRPFPNDAPGIMEVHALLFDPALFVGPLAAAWARAHGYNGGPVVMTESGELRIEQQPAAAFDENGIILGVAFRRAQLEEGVVALLGRPKESPLTDEQLAKLDEIKARLDKPLTEEEVERRLKTIQDRLNRTFPPAPAEPVVPSALGSRLRAYMTGGR